MKTEKRFEKIYSQGTFASQTEIWIDKETGVHYLFHRDGNAAGFTPLLNQDGKPVISIIDDSLGNNTKS